MPGNRLGHGMAFADPAQSKIIVAGGKGGSDYLSSTDIYDIASSTWSSGPAMDPHDYSFAIVGGILTAVTQSDSSGIYQFDGTSWEQKSFELALGVKFDASMVYTGDLYQKCNVV